MNVSREREGGGGGRGMEAGREGESGREGEGGEREGRKRERVGLRDKMIYF